MPLLEIYDLSKHFGVLQVLDSVRFQIDPQAKVGLVGRNGAGKSTMLNIIEGREDFDGGRVTFQSGVRLGYLTQEPEFAPGRTIEDEMLAVFEYLRVQGEQLNDLEAEMGRPEVTASPERLDDLMARYSSLRERFERGGGYSYRTRIRSVLTGLGLSSGFWSRPIDQLSGGEKTRTALARLLLTEPDLLLLDEPTNYLDVAAIEWLERFLHDYPGSVLLVSHDRYFLDRVVTSILELADRKITRYNGNYTAYCQQRAAMLEAWERAYSLQQKEITRQEKMIREARATEKAKKEADSRQKRLDHVERLDRPPDEARAMRVQFSLATRSGRRVLDVEHLEKRFGERQLIHGVTFSLEAGDHVALLGPNGAGKTTLLRMLLAQEPLDSGRIRWGHGVVTGFYAQEEPEVDPNGTPFEEIIGLRGMNNEQARTHLARFLFRGDDVFKSNEDLSGGEKRRLALAKLVLTRANFLVLDEPTNHLDLSSIEALEEALDDYDGTLLFVSHDRYFVNQVANRLLLFESDGTISTFDGSYEIYQTVRATQAENAAEARKAAESESARKDWRSERPKKVSRRVYEELERVEQEVHALETRRQEIARLLCEPGVFDNYQETVRLTEEDAGAAGRLSALYDRWTELNIVIEESNAAGGGSQ